MINSLLSYTPHPAADELSGQFLIPVPPVVLLPAWTAVNDKYAFLPEEIGDRGLAITGNIGKMLEDTGKYMTEK